MNMNSIIEKLRAKGYNAALHTVIKNGVAKCGITIANGAVSPCIYVDSILNKIPGIEPDALVRQIIRIYETHKTVDIDVKQILAPSYIHKNIFIGMQKSSEEALFKKPTQFEGLEQYLYVRISSPSTGVFSIKLNSSIIEHAGIHSLDELWEAAQRNTFSPGETVIQSIDQIIADLIGYNDLNNHEAVDPENGLVPMFVVSNPLRSKGAVQILDKKALLSFAREQGVNQMIMLPSSIHECIILPVKSEAEIDLTYFSAMVTEINQIQVAPEERLTNRAYIIHT